MSIESVVQVSVTNATPSLTQAGFGTPLVLGFHTRWPERFRIYTDASDMLDDGFVAMDPEYIAVNAIFAQNPRPQQVIVGRRLTAPTQILEITPVNLTSGYEYKIQINDEEATYTVQPADTAALVVAGLVSALNGLTAAMTALPLAGPDRVQLTADTAGVLFKIDGPADGSVTLETTTPDAGIATDLAEIQALTDDWYGLILTFKTKHEVLAAAAFVEGAKKLLIAASSDSDIGNPLSTTDLGFLAKPFARTAIMCHHAPYSHPDAAWMGKLFPEAPGSTNWAYKTLATVQATPRGVAGPSALVALQAKNVNAYIECSGVSHTRFGTVGSGEYLDIVRGLDWLQARLGERVFALLNTVKKVPFTEVGVALIKKEILAQLEAGATAGLLVADTISVTFPPVSSISAVDKGNRCLPDGKFSAQLQGAINKVVLRGEVFV